MPLQPERFRKLFIGGLDYRTTDQDLKEYFSQYGEVLDCVVLKDKITRRSRGFGFVTFSDPSMVDVVQDSRPHIMYGREVQLKRAVPRKYFEDFGGHITVNKVFVGGLLDDTEASDLRDYFSAYGTVRNVDVLRDRGTNRKRGFAFVEFNDYDPVDKVVLSGEHIIGGKAVDVKKALSRHEMNILRGHQYEKLWRDSVQRERIRAMGIPHPHPYGAGFGLEMPQFPHAFAPHRVYDGLGRIPIP